MLLILMPSLTQATIGWLSTPTILKENEGDYRYKKHPTGGGVMGGICGYASIRNTTAASTE